MPETQRPLFADAPDPPAGRDTGPDPCGSGVVLYIDEVEGRLIAAPTLCGRWACLRCGPMRLSRARALARAGKPERMITLTTRPKPGWAIEPSVRWFRRRWSLLLARIRRTFGAFEYMQITELHKSNWPHMHILTRGCYIPQRMLSAWWLELTGSYKVYIQKIDNTWKGVREATKYCLKTARAFHQTCPSLPVYTKSRGWSPDKDDDEKRPPGNYTFYCYVPMGWRYFREIVESLDCTAEPIPDSPGRLEIRSRAPPRRATLDAIFGCGSFADMTAAAALQEWFARDRSNPVPIEELQDRVEWAGAHDRAFVPLPAGAEPFLQTPVADSLRTQAEVDAPWHLAAFA